MKKITYLSVIILFVSCAQETKIVGKWEMYKVFQDSTDVTADHNPNKNRFIEFFEDGRFISGGDPHGENTGSYSFDEDDILFIDSDAGPNDDSYWSITYSGDQMKWKGVGVAWAERFMIVHTKSNQ